jgi:hypothetical protein
MKWALIIGGIFVVIVLLFTSTPLSRLVAKPGPRRHELDQ